MPSLQEQLNAAADQIEADAAKLHSVVHGSATTTVATEGGTLKSVAKTLADIEAALEAGNVTGIVTAARDLAQGYAEAPLGTEVEAGKYSAKHWAAKAADFAHQLTADFPTQVFTWTEGAGDPAPENGAEGDHYRDTVSGQIWRKAGDTWFQEPGVMLRHDPGYVNGLEVALGTTAYLWPGLDFTYGLHPNGAAYLYWAAPPASGTSIRIRYNAPKDGGGAGGLAVIHLDDTETWIAGAAEEDLVTYDLSPGYMTTPNRRLALFVAWKNAATWAQHDREIKVYFGSVEIFATGRVTPHPADPGGWARIELISLGPDSQLVTERPGGQPLVASEPTAAAIRIRVTGAGEAAGDIAVTHLIVQGSAQP
jgi:hypothetical protein